MRFLSYNLRNAGIREEQHTSVLDGWSHRRDAVLDLITKEDPDVLALQEDSREQLEYIRDAFKKSHNVFLDPAFYDADNAFHAILVRNTLAVADSGAFWISPNERVRSKIDGSIRFRHATYVRLQRTDPPLRVVNVHLDHTDDQTVKQRESEVFIDLLGKISGSPPTRTIVMGDFNYVPTTRAHFLLQDFGMLDSALLLRNHEGTFSCWTKVPPSHRIDYIWLSNDLKRVLKTYRVIRGAYCRQDGSSGCASDHAAISADFEI